MGARHVSPPMKSEPLTEQSIQKRLNRFFASWKYNVDGLFVFSWESDKLIWTKAGYIYEFEIKISRSDFKNDFKHKKEKHVILSATIDREYAEKMQASILEDARNDWRHWDEESLMRQFGSVEHTIEGKRLPNYFYYAVPEDLIKPEEVPPYAGLIYIAKEYQYVAQSFRIIKEAPRLHKTKYKDGELNLGDKFYYNFKSALEKLRKEEELTNMYRERLETELASKGHAKTYEQMEQELKRATDDAEYWKKTAGEHCRNNICVNAERKRLRREILKLVPDFDFKPIEDEVDKLYDKKDNPYL